MLYNPRWGRRNHLLSLTAWLRRKKPEERYEYFYGEVCLLAQYFSAAYKRRLQVGIGYIYNNDRSFIAVMPEDFNAIAEQEPHTFGAALERAEACLRQD